MTEQWEPQVRVHRGTGLPKGRLEPLRGLECQAKRYVLYAAGQGWSVDAPLHADMPIDGDF